MLIKLKVLVFAVFAPFLAVFNIAWAEEAAHWRILGSSALQVEPGRAYALQNLSNLNVLVYGHQDHGINLRNMPAKKMQMAPRSIVFWRESSGSKEPLKYGERVSIQVLGAGEPGQYVHYVRQPYSVNLGFSADRKYEWELRGGPEGSNVNPASVDLYSHVEGDVLVYCKRASGVNLRWLQDKESKGCHTLMGTVIEKGREFGLKAGCQLGGPEVAAACAATGVYRKKVPLPR